HVSDDYGGDAAFAAFVAAAHARGLKVVLDLSFTVVADQHPWFVAARNAGAPERSRFVVAPGPPCPTLSAIAGGNGWHPFGDAQCFFSDYAASFPSIDGRDPVVAAAARDVGAHWLGLGADGFRLDSAPSIVQIDPAHPLVKDPSSGGTHAFWRAFM